jgi:DNA-binding transcriptional MerR regulator
MDYHDIGRNYLNVTEFAKLVGITAEALRHYDRKDIFKPAKYGNEFDNKYRLYDPTQITTIKMIRVLTEIGVPLHTIKELSQNRTPEKLMKLLSKHQGIIADELRFLQDTFLVISTFLELLTDGISAMESEISVSEQPEKQIILGDVNDFSDSVGFYREFISFCNVMHEPTLNLAFPVGGYFESMDEFLHHPSLPTRFFSLCPNGREKKAAGLYLIGYTRGYYGQTNDLPGKLTEFAKKNGLVCNGPVYQLYLFDEMSIVDKDQYLLQVSVSVKETRRVPSRRPIRR